MLLYNSLTKAEQYKFIDVKIGETIAYIPLNNTSQEQEAYTKKEREVIIRSGAFPTNLVELP